MTYNVGLVPSKFYEVLGARPRDGEAFRNIALVSIGWVLGQAFVRISVLYPFSLLFNPSSIIYSYDVVMIDHH